MTFDNLLLIVARLWFTGVRKDIFTKFGNLMEVISARNKTFYKVQDNSPEEVCTVQVLSSFPHKYF